MLQRISTQIAKTVMVALNGFFLLCGIAVVTLGFVDIRNSRSIKQVIEGFSGTNAAIIAVGALICIISFMGCCGSLTEDTCMLTSYKVFMIIILITQISVGIILFVKRWELETIVASGARQTIRYTDQHMVNHAWDEIQIRFSCCGADSPLDYLTMGRGYPSSCCKLPLNKACDPFTSGFNSRGCIPQLTKFLKQKYFALGIAVLVVTMIEIIGILYAACLKNAIEDDELSTSSVM